MGKRGGTLIVSTANTNDDIEASFEDKGMSTKNENIQKLFTSFVTTQAQGMGIDLPRCERFVESYKGSIKVEN